MLPLIFSKNNSPVDESRTNYQQDSKKANRRMYQQKDVDDFLAIKEMQSMGLSLNEIQLLFDVKRNNGCGTKELIHHTIKKLEEKRREFEKQEAIIQQQKNKLTSLSVR
ncbi:helix-turn-helix domain-containing protein [Ornithinibacillus contaminans]|uniref:helix-turn-helix domain-containing protein n=1 Tax=Ornithinibacillus contaminans TaxID=694055 RepID=UPI0009F8EFC9|nr:MerR family DNA-binding protein [Ornithinibacillus contaminans]